MNKIDLAFKKQSNPLLSVYITAGFPELHSLETILPALEQHGVDIVEIGMPFSDPLADGPVIQKSSLQAINNGMNLETLFKQLEKIRVSVPLILMGYLNPIWQFGLERFLIRCYETGVSGTIIPDLPVDIYLRHKNLFEKNGVYNILLATPQTSNERLSYLSEHTNGFLYAVSSASTTGTKSFSESNPQFFKRLNQQCKEVKTMIGFGIKTAEDFQRAGEFASGAIIGTRFIELFMNNSTDNNETNSNIIAKFVNSIRYTNNSEP